MAAQIFLVAQIFPTVSFGEKIVTKECNCYGHSCSSNLFLCCQFESYGSFLRLENELPKDCQIGGCSAIFLSKECVSSGHSCGSSWIPKMNFCFKKIWAIGKIWAATKEFVSAPLASAFHLLYLHDFCTALPVLSKTDDLNLIFAFSFGPGKREEGESSLL